MKLPEIPDDDDARVDELHRYDVLDTAAEQAYDALVKIASEVTGRPIALVSLVDRDRQWFKARVGLGAEETGRDVSFCAHMVTKPEPLVVRDALDDERFRDNPLVTGNPDIRFYAGAPIISPNEYVLGSLCVIDTVPGDITDEQLTILELLADQAVRLLEMRRIASQWKQDRREARHFFEASLDLLCVASFDGFFRDLNGVWVDLLGYDLETLKSKPFAEFIHPDDRKSVFKEISELARSGGELREFSVRFLRADGEARVLQFNATADLESKRYIAAARDITEADERERALAAARDAAEEANRAKSVFLANMSHELRTPLNSVIGFANVLMKNRQDNLLDKQLNYLTRIRDNGQHLLSLLNDILDVSKIEVGQLEFVREPIDVVSLAQEVMMAVAPDDERLQLDAPTVELQTIVGDGLRLKQVLTNLIGNAVKFSPGGKPVTVRVNAVGEAPRSIEVIDQGIGIAPEALNRIFEPFEQAESGTERRFGGTGLGLTISKSLCDSMGFGLVASSELGTGSTFRVEFDARSSAAPSPTRPKVATPPPNRRDVVLIIDDEPESRLILETVVGDLGFSVVACDTPRLALALADTLRPRAVLLDLMMPEIDGFDVLGSFEQHPTLQDVPVVIVSIVGPENRTRLAHAAEVLPKPTERADLARILGDLSLEASRVLVVDDDENARRIVEAALADVDVELVEAENGEEALQRLDEQRVDAIVLDLTMPVMDGYTFLDRLRDDPRFDGVPVIVFSALQGSAARLTDRVTAIVRKDGDTDSLRNALQRVL